MTAISGLMLPALVKKDLIPATVPVPKALDNHHHLMWVLTIIVTLPLLLEVPNSGTPTTPSGTEKDCYPGTNCCANTRQPWFWRTLKQETNNDITVRWCADRRIAFTNFGTELLEIFIH